MQRAAAPNRQTKGGRTKLKHAENSNSPQEDVCTQQQGPPDAPCPDNSPESPLDTPSPTAWATSAAAPLPVPRFIELSGALSAGPPAPVPNVASGPMHARLEMHSCELQHDTKVASGPDSTPLPSVCGGSALAPASGPNFIRSLVMALEPAITSSNTESDTPSYCSSPPLSGFLHGSVDGTPLPGIQFPCVHAHKRYKKKRRCGMQDVRHFSSTTGKAGPDSNRKYLKSTAARNFPAHTAKPLRQWQSR